ncbi:hypothetical protein NL676_005069 [Syzygium grande]|nr:hypothetical protein NL676_005069 [Syzygium grande]
MIQGYLREPHKVMMGNQVGQLSPTLYSRGAKFKLEKDQVKVFPLTVLYHNIHVVHLGKGLGNMDMDSWETFRGADISRRSKSRIGCTTKNNKKSWPSTAKPINGNSSTIQEEATNGTTKSEGAKASSKADTQKCHHSTCVRIK